MPENDQQWNEVATEALRALGASERPTRGAALRMEIERRTTGGAAALSSMLETQGLKFGEFVESIDGVEVRKLPGTDMYVALAGAAFTDDVFESTDQNPAGGNRLRKDVYDAFTEIGGNFYYSPDLDQFSSSSGEGQPVQVPEVTVDHLVARRRSYVDQLARSASKDLLETALRDPSPLRQFSQGLRTLRLQTDWHRFNLATVVDEIKSWCETNELSFNPAWLVHTPFSAHRLPTQEVLRLVSKHMTEEEIRNLRIPFRAIESLVNELARRG